MAEEEKLETKGHADRRAHFKIVCVILYPFLSYQLNMASVQKVANIISVTIV